jgi:LacI family transcriptional regulator
MENVSLKTIATRLQLSTATVSKALRDSHEISAETKERVRTLASALNYVPNPYASSLRRKISKTIAVVIPEVADSFFADAINGIETIAQSKGYHVLIYLTHESVEKEKRFFSDLQSGRVDGVLLSISVETVATEHIADLQRHSIPIVIFDRVCDDIKTATVSTNDYEAGYAATKHLIENNCKKIAYLSFSARLSITAKRMQGYKQALADNNLLLPDDFVVSCSSGEENDIAAIEQLLLLENRPDGIIASVEKLTTHVYVTCQKFGLKIPQDVAVVSFANLKTAPILNPPLTTVTQPAFEMGKAAATLLFKALEKKNFNLNAEALSIPSVLHVRDSSNKTALQKIQI